MTTLPKDSVISRCCDGKLSASGRKYLAAAESGKYSPERSLVGNALQYLTEAYKNIALAYAELHLVAAEVVIRQALKPRAELLVSGALRNRARNLGVLQHFVFNKNRAIHPQRQCQRVARPRINGHHLPVALHPNQRVKSIVLQIVDDHLLHSHLKPK